MRTDPKKAGLVGAVIIGGWHVVWSLLIILGWAQALVNFSLWAHMLQVPVVAGPFDVAAAATVIVIAAIIGYAVGYILATVWNRVHSA
ncbi:MAG TPA: hypothetical protein VJG64_00110 [Candidatus Paceibacterota bacterium]